MRKKAFFFDDQPCARSLAARSIVVALLNQATGIRFSHSSERFDARLASLISQFERAMSDG
jgi:hypothetical protein